MNTNTSAVIGLGAIGTLIAYFGYQYLDDEDANDKVGEDNLYNDESKDDENDDAQDLSSNVLEDISKNKIKLEVEEVINKKSMEKKEDDEKQKKIKQKINGVIIGKFNMKILISNKRLRTIVYLMYTNMGCPNTFNINLSGKTIIGFLIVINLLFFVSYTIKHNPFESFSSISGEISDNFTLNYDVI